ncbi:MAG: M43 family zinc metalloprotease [Bacteroidota bacterium]
MKKLLIALCLFTVAAQAQEKCLSEILFQEEAKKDPSLFEKRQRLEEFTESWIQQNSNAQQRNTSSAATYVIPVVFHVIHRGGGENISDAQIMSQINVLNADFRRLNADTGNTPTPWLPIAADCDIEFKLAQLDDLGECTTGITRTYSPLTTNARNNVKSLIYWPANKYLNIWVVESIENTSTIVGGIVAGFAQFPGTGPLTTDGIVVRHDYCGTIGTAANTGGFGRTSTHEIGHWFNLRHIWGDEPNCAQDDFVSDTPLQATYTFSTCPAFPFFDQCAATGNGAMFPNYMDYTDAACQNIYTIGQSNRMHAALNSPTSGRNNLWSPGNLTATGTDGVSPVVCSPVADFLPKQKFVCEGNAVPFKDLSWGGATTSRLWTFNGATPATDTSALPSVVYPTAGLYDVSLAVTNSTGTSTKTVNDHVVVSPLATSLSVNWSEGFEAGTFPFNDWYIGNENGGSEWEVTGAASATGFNSLFVDNFGGGQKGQEEFITPAFNLSGVTGTNMTFKLAFAYKSNANLNDDRLVIYSSTNCGQTWTLKRTIGGTALSTTTGFYSSPFTPAPSDWALETVNLTSTTISNKPNVRFKFEYTYAYGNNIYIDDINLTGVVDVQEALSESANIQVYPNPSEEHTYVSFTTLTAGKVVLEVLDVMGRKIQTINNDLDSGDHQILLSNHLDAGTYFVRLLLDNGTITRKVVMN